MQLSPKSQNELVALLRHEILDKPRPASKPRVDFAELLRAEYLANPPRDALEHRTVDSEIAFTDQYGEFINQILFDDDEFDE